MSGTARTKRQPRRYSPEEIALIIVAVVIASFVVTASPGFAEAEEGA